MCLVGADMGASGQAGRQRDRRKDSHDEADTNFSLVYKGAKKDEVFPDTRHEGT